MLRMYFWVDLGFLYPTFTVSCFVDSDVATLVPSFSETRSPLLPHLQPKTDQMDLDVAKKPLRVTDGKREVRLGLTASSLDQFEERVRSKLEIDSELTMRVVLELDGTEIDDEDYFATLDPHTCLMILLQEERWTPYKSNFILGLAVESEGGSSEGSSPVVEELIWRLHQDLSFFPWLTLNELETIAKMDREQMRNIVPDPNFLEFLQTLCERYLQEKDNSSDSSTNTSSSNTFGGPTLGSNGGSTKTASILNDPLKLIRLYSKFNAMKAQNGGAFSFSSCGSEESIASLHHATAPPQQRPITPRHVNNNNN